MGLNSPKSFLFLIGCIAVISAVPVPYYEIPDYHIPFHPAYLDYSSEEYGDWGIDAIPYLRPMHAPFMGKKPPPPGALNSGRSGHPPTDGPIDKWMPNRPKPGRQPRPVRPIIPPFWRGKYVLF